MKCAPFLERDLSPLQIDVYSAPYSLATGLEYQILRVVCRSIYRGIDLTYLSSHIHDCLGKILNLAEMDGSVYILSPYRMSLSKDVLTKNLLFEEIVENGFQYQIQCRNFTELNTLLNRLDKLKKLNK